MLYIIKNFFYEIFFIINLFYINNDFFNIIEYCFFYIVKLIFIINNFINSLIIN